jgi:hypothetical protein
MLLGFSMIWRVVLQPLVVGVLLPLLVPWQPG